MPTETLRPNAAGHYTNLSKTPGNYDNWQCVNEVEADNLSSYVYCTSSYRADLYNLPAHSEGLGTINFIKIYFRCAAYSASEGTAKPYFQSGAIYPDDCTTGTEISLTTTDWATYSEQWATNPATGSAFTWDDIDILQIGVWLEKTVGYWPMCTQVYVEVDYSIATPTVTTDDATVLGRTTYADLNGTLDDDGGEACNCGFEWGLTTGYGNTTSTQSKTTGESFTKTITGLSSNTTYHFRAIATNSAGTDYGDDKTFTTTIPGELKFSTLRLLSYDCRGIWYPTRRIVIQCTVLSADDLMLKDGSIDTQTAATIKAAIEEARDDATWPVTFYDIDGSTVYVKVLSARYRMADVTKERNKEHVFDLILLKVPLE